MRLSFRSLFSFAICGATLVAPFAATPAEVAPPDSTQPVVWRAIRPGAERATPTADHGIQILLFRFSLDRFRAEVSLGRGWPPRPETAAAVRRRRKAIAVVNGGFFDQRGAPLGLRIEQGKTRVRLRRKVDWGVLLLEGASARIVHSREIDRGTPVLGAIQVGPRLVVAGKPLKLKPQLARRTAVALDDDGRRLTLVVVDKAIDANELAARLAACGFDSALMLDGGASTQLALDAGGVQVDIRGAYPVPDHLVIVAGPPMPASR